MYKIVRNKGVWLLFFLGYSNLLFNNLDHSDSIDTDTFFMQNFNQMYQLYVDIDRVSENIKNIDTDSREDLLNGEDLKEDIFFFIYQEAVDILRRYNQIILSSSDAIIKNNKKAFILLQKKIEQLCRQVNDFFGDRANVFPGVVHNDALGVASSSLIVDADVSSTAGIVDTKLATISTAGKVANSATTATSTNTANAIVTRDGSGNFSAGTITASLSGNATTATTATNFSGSLSGDVTGTQGATVVSSVGGQTAANIALATVAANAATNVNTASTIVKRDASGNFSTTMITLTGTTTNATDAATKAYVDSVVGSPGTNLNTPNTTVKRDGTGSFAAQTISLVDEVASGNISLNDSTSATVGNIVKNGTAFIHNFGTNNTFVGKAAGNFTMSGTGANTGVGVSALIANTTGIQNTALGASAGIAVTTGSNNVMLGYNVGSSTTTGSNNIYIDGSGLNPANESNTIRIGNTQTSCYIKGIVGVNVGLSSTVRINNSTGQLGTVNSSRNVKHNIQNVSDQESELIYALRPVSFIYNGDKTNTKEFGLIAEEVEEVFPLMAEYDEQGVVYSVRYDMIPILVLKEVKKLKNQVQQQQETIKQQAEELRQQKQEICALMQAVRELQSSVQSFVTR